MPWRTHKNCIPNNKVVAEKRLSYLKRELQSNSDLHIKYTGAIKNTSIQVTPSPYLLMRLIPQQVSGTFLIMAS